MQILSELFSPEGRWNRFKFLVYQLVSISILSLVFGGLFFLIIDHTKEYQWLLIIAGVLVLLYLIAVMLITIYSVMKRLRDLDKNPWFTILMFTPIISFGLLIYCVFFKGTQGPNRFGLDPLSESTDIPKEKPETVEL